MPLKKFWITMGQAHIHKLNGIIVDKNVVVELEARNMGEAIERGYKLFGAKFADVYEKKPNMAYYPGGVFILK